MQIQQTSAQLQLTPAALQHQRSQSKAAQLLPPELCFGEVDKLLLGRVAASMVQPNLIKLLDGLSTQNVNGESLSSLGVGSVKAGLMSAAFSGIYASIHRYSAVQKGEVDARQATTQVITDSIGGFGAGAAAGLGIGLTSLALRSLGISGVPLALGAAAAGAVSGLSATQYYHRSGWRERVATELAEHLEKPAQQTPAEKLLPPDQALRRSAKTQSSHS